MEACGTAHNWGRRCQARGVAVRLLLVQYVRPYVRRNKTDRTDTEGMLEAHRCAGTQPVPVKTIDQQAIEALHRVRTQWQATRTTRINVLRGQLREKDYPVPVGARTVLTRVLGLLDDPARDVPASLSALASPWWTKCAPWKSLSPRSIASSPRSGRHATVPTGSPRLQHWAVTLAARRGHNKTAIALANTLARIFRASWSRDTDFYSPAALAA